MSITPETLSWEFDSPVSQQFPVFTRANVSEVMPNVLTPLNWTLIGLGSSELGWRDAWVRLGAFDRDEFSDEHPEAHCLFGGYLYLNLSVMRRFAARTPGMTTDMIDESLLGAHPNVPPHCPSPLDDSPAHSERLGSFLAGVFAITELPELAVGAALAEDMRRNRPVLSTLTPAQLVEYLRASNDQVRPLLGQHIVVTMSSSVALGLVSTICGELLGDPRKSLDLVSALGDVVSAEMALDLWELGRVTASTPGLMSEFDRGVEGLLDRLGSTDEYSEFLAEFHRVLRKHEFRGVDEFNIAAPTWGLRPELPLAAIERMRFASDAASPAARSKRLSAERERLTADVLDRLKGDETLHAQFETGLRVAQMLMRARERSKTTLLVPLYEIRLAALELGRRMASIGAVDQADDVFYLADEELDGFLVSPGDYGDRIRSRRRTLTELAQLRPPHIISETVPEFEQWVRKDSKSAVSHATAGSVLQGVGGCPGRQPGSPE